MISIVLQQNETFELLKVSSSLFPLNALICVLQTVEAERAALMSEASLASQEARSLHCAFGPRTDTYV